MKEAGEFRMLSADSEMLGAGTAARQRPVRMLGNGIAARPEGRWPATVLRSWNLLQPGPAANAKQD